MKFIFFMEERHYLKNAQYNRQFKRCCLSRSIIIYTHVQKFWPWLNKATCFRAFHKKTENCNIAHIYNASISAELLKMFQKIFHYVNREALERIVYEKTPPSASNLTYKIFKKLLQKIEYKPNFHHCPLPNPICWDVLHVH